MNPDIYWHPVGVCNWTENERGPKEPTVKSGQKRKNAANNPKPSDAAVQACIQGALDRFNTARTVALANANQSFQNNWKPNIDFAGKTALGLIITSKLIGNPITGAVVGRAVAAALTAQATWYGLKAQVQFVYQDLQNAGALQYAVEQCRQHP